MHLTDSDYNNLLHVNPPKVDLSDVAGYRIFRSPTNHTMVNIVAVDKKDRLLFVAMSDLTIEQAQEIIENEFV